MKKKEVIATKRKSNYLFLFTGLVALFILMQVIIYAALGSTQLEELNLFRLTTLYILNPIATLIYLLITTIIGLI